MTQQSPPRDRRSANEGPRAASRNRAALVAAAREVYAESGLQAPMSAIARRAEVGQGVLYRHFPDRAAMAIAVLEENVRQIEQAAAADGTDMPRLLGVLTWHQIESAAFVGILHAEAAGSRSGPPTYVLDLAQRVERALRRHLPEGHRLAAQPEDLMIAVAMVSAAASGPTHEQRERRTLAAWRLLGVEVGTVRPFEG